MSKKQTLACGLSAEADLIARAIERDESAIRSIIKSHNRRLYRLARSIVRDDGEAEDVLQEAYLRAFASLANFRGEASLATWLTRIVLNEGLQRVRRRQSTPPLESLPIDAGESRIIPFPLNANPPADPERDMAQRQICQMLEHAIDELPEDFRTVLVARVVEDMSVEETADLLGLRPETVKTRLHRARRMLKASLSDQIGPLVTGVFPFDGMRCARIADRVIEGLAIARSKV